jgi:sialic acid synthase SpsE
MKTALALIDTAAAAGADAVKFQAFTADNIVAKMGDKHPYIEKMFPDSGTMHEVYAKLELPRAWLKDLKAYSEEKALIFLCTPFDEEAVDLLERLEIAAYKIASYELWHLPLIRHAARTGKPLLVSTGMANLGDIEEALEAVESMGNEQAALFHCAVNYPDHEARLRCPRGVQRSLDGDHGGRGLGRARGKPPREALHPQQAAPRSRSPLLRRTRGARGARERRA